jgi:signal transduction histidine kinase
MERRPLRVLLIEDEPIDVMAVRRDLVRASEDASRFDLEHAATLQAGLDRLGKGDVDVVLLDLHLPDGDGPDAVRRVREADAEVPIVTLTVAEGEALALAALRAGAQDHLVKGEVQGSSLRRALRHAIERQLIARESHRRQHRRFEIEKRSCLGVLGAGTAMAFNRLLGDVLDEADRAIEGLDPADRSHRLREHLHEIRRTAVRAGEIAGRLRDYAAAPPGREAPTDLSEFVLATSDFVESTVAGGARVHWHLARQGPLVMAGRLQLHQILLSLVTNAAEATGKQGRIVISTGTLRATRELLDRTEGCPEPAEGSYAFLRVADDGPGMDAATRARIFDPFFTTRYAGRGLGLAALHGILRELRSVVRVESQPGHGSTFTVLFPVRPRAQQSRAPRRSSAGPADRPRLTAAAGLAARAEGTGS